MCACTHLKPYAPYATYIHAPPTPQKNQELLRKPADKRTLNILIAGAQKLPIAEVQTCVLCSALGSLPFSTQIGKEQGPLRQLIINYEGFFLLRVFLPLKHEARDWSKVYKSRPEKNMVFFL